MSCFADEFRWDFTSTGTGKAHRINAPHEAVTFGLEPSTNSTATIQILHRMGSSAGTYAVLSTVQCASTGQFVTDQFLGPLEWVKPRVVDKTAGGTSNTVTVYLKAV